MAKSINSPQKSVAIVVPNWNGKDILKPCLDSLLAQSLPATVFVVENGSADGSLEYLRQNYPDVRLVVNQVNLGFAGGVNSGIREALRDNFTYVALFNNDAVADKNWLKHLAIALEKNSKAGIATCKLQSSDKKHLDSTGECYTVWGLPYPRGRGEPVGDRYDDQTTIFGASGGASLYRCDTLKHIGLFDEDFFAYYEDLDISFRARLAGWEVLFVPKAVVFHQIGATGNRAQGFYAYQTMKNLPWLLIKNVPKRYLKVVVPRFALAYAMFFGRAILRGHGIYAARGFAASCSKLRAKWRERREILSAQTVEDERIWELMTHDLPANAHNLRKLREYWWKLMRRAA